MTKLRNLDIRPAMKQDVTEHPSIRTDWSRVKVAEVAHERNYN